MLCDGKILHCYGHDSFEQGWTLFTSLNTHIGIIKINHIGHIPTNGCQYFKFMPKKQKKKKENDEREAYLLN
jgi:hypothetical protein